MKIKKQWTGRLFLELITIFIGVYLAFELNRYQEGRRAEQLKINYFTSFRSEIRKTGTEITYTSERVKKIIKEFNDDLAAGKMPALKPVNLHLNSAMLITKAGFNDDVFIELNSNLASSLSGGYDNVKTVGRHIEYFNEICNRNLISSEIINFYNRDGSLKPQYDWYLEGLIYLDRLLDNLSEQINKQAIPYTENMVLEMQQK